MKQNLDLKHELDLLAWHNVYKARKIITGHVIRHQSTSTIRVDKVMLAMGGVCVAFPPAWAFGLLVVIVLLHLRNNSTSNMMFGINISDCLHGYK